MTEPTHPQTTAEASRGRRIARERAQALKPWQGYIENLKAFATREGLEIEVRNPGAPQYQIARLTADGVRVIVYPHTANTMNQHARVRDENSSDKAKAEAVMGKLGLWVKNRGPIA